MQISWRQRTSVLVLDKEHLYLYLQMYVHIFYAEDFIVMQLNS